MKNGYFRVICGGNGVSVRIVLPKDGGEFVSVKELMDYLDLRNIPFELSALNKGIQDAVASKQAEYGFMISHVPAQEVREGYVLLVSQDKMTATARFYPPSLHGERMCVEEFLNDLAVKKIIFGIKTKEIEQFFAAPEYCTDFVVASGVQPRQGSDARIEYYFNTDLDARPTLLADGSVDFFHLNTVCCCQKGQVLARLFPEDPGEYGSTIYGERIKPRTVKKETLRFSNNISLSEDRQTITSEVNGHVTLVDGKVFVSDILEVKDVDSSTGDIDYEGSVKINGNVCANFSVRAKGDIEVSGVVEGAYLEAGGDIIITRGMNGMIKGTLKAGGNIVAKFIENAKVHADGYISTESILHSDVYAATEILVSGRRGFITGGKVSAMNLVRVKTLGSSMGADTVVEVGVDPSIKQELTALQKQVAENKKTLDALYPVLSSMAQKLSQGVKLKPEQLKYLQDLIATEKLKKQEQESSIMRMKQLQVILDESANARVEVTGEVFGGTKICIADVSMVVKNSMSYCKFVKQQGEVKMTAL